MFLAALCGTPGYAESVQVGNTHYSLQLMTVDGAGTSVAVGDFNEDGFPDLAVTSKSDGGVFIFTGGKQESFAPLARYDAGREPSEIVASDLNGDGHLDLVIANHETRYVTLYDGDGKGGFSPAEASPLSIDVSPHPHIVRVADVNDDDVPDLIVDNRDKNGLLLIEGLGDGRFSSRGREIPTGGDPYLGFAIDDINADGLPDFVTPNTDHLGVALGKGTQTLAYETYKRIAADRPFAVKLVDLNADKYLDIVYASMTGIVSVFFGDGSGEYNATNKMAMDFAAGAKRIARGDINGDGVGDVMISNWSTDVMVVFGSDTVLVSHRFKPEGIENPWMLQISDLNRDGKADLIVADGSGDKVAVYMSTTRNALTGDKSSRQ
ncbi:MAG: VCBS repeat-containing protein [Pseudomonadota bacterium]